MNDNKTEFDNIAKGYSVLCGNKEIVFQQGVI
jgi:hypothetical protein